MRRSTRETGTVNSHVNITCGGISILSRLIISMIVSLVMISSYASAKESDSDIARITLKNGLQVVVIRSPLAPVATTVMNYLVGSNEAPDQFPGMAHAQEHMMFRGSPGLTAQQLADI
ncbi:MAG: insulinase family protein, partial [Sedimentisphaerales bacterium]